MKRRVHFQKSAIQRGHPWQGKAVSTLEKGTSLHRVTAEGTRYRIRRTPRVDRAAFLCTQVDAVRTYRDLHIYTSYGYDTKTIWPSTALPFRVEADVIESA